MLSNAIISDRRLSWAARGMLAFLLSKPDDWTVNTAALVAETADCDRPAARDAVRAALSELGKAGYLTRELDRAGGKFDGAGYVIHETPQDISPRPDFPAPVLPAPADPHLLKTDLNQGPKEPTPQPPQAGAKVRKKAERKFDYSPEFEAFWEAYPNKRGGKVLAWEEYPKAVEAIGGASTLLLNLRAYQFDDREEFKFSPHAHRWLARRAWDDDYDAQSKRVWAILMAEEARKPAAPVPPPLEGIPM